MKHHFLTVLITIILAFQFACTEKVESAGTESPFSPTIPKETPTPEKDEFWYEKVDVSQKQLSYKGYKFSKKIKKVRVENDVIINDNYVLVTKNGKKITEFYDFAESQLAEYQFGLFPMLGDENNKQMIVEATLPKSWRYWIIDFSPEFRIIFDSSKYNLGHDLRLLDINRDGKRELQLDLMTFNYFGINRRYGWVTPPMIFQFDEKKKRYVFANPEFENYLLADIDEKRGKINQAKQQQSTTETYGCKTYSPVMDLFLTFVYLEKHDEAWRVFEEYECPDKEAVRIEIKKYLSEDSLIS